MSRILVTGATGFIGSKLAQCAHARGLHVTATGPVRNEIERSRYRELAAAGIEVVDATLDDTDRIRTALESQDIVVHLAAAQHEASQPETYFHSVNVEGTRRLLQLAQEAGVRRFVFASSIGVYGDSGVRELSERDPVAPANAYTRSKVAAEEVVRAASDRIEVTIARISETYGPGDRRLLKLFRSIEQGTYRTIGDGKNLHQLIYIDDLCRALIELAFSPKAAGETFILAGAERVTTDDMVSAVGRAVGRPAPRMPVPAFPFQVVAAACETLAEPLGIQPPLHRRRLDFFLKSFQFCTSKAQRVVGFRAEVSVDEGMRRTADSYRSQGLLNDSDSREPNPVHTLMFATGVGLLLLLLWRMQHYIGPLAEGLFTKEGPFELVTFLLELLAAGWCLTTVYLLPRRAASFSHPVRWLYGLLGVILLFVSMEEINWGQTLMGFQTPEAWSAINYQHETSIHNLVDKSVLTRAWKIVSTLFGLSVLALVAIRARAPQSMLGAIAPHPALAPLAFCVTYAGLRQHPEMVELLLSVFFAFYSYRVWTLAQRSPRVPLPSGHRDRPSIFSHAGKIVRVLVAATLLALLIERFDWSKAERIAAAASVPLLLGAFVAMSLTLVFSTWKWDWALQLHGLRYRFSYLLRTLSIGFFFNHFLPTSIGGDAYRVLQTLPQNGFRSRALSAVVVERAIGFITLLTLGTVGALRLIETRGVMHEYLFGVGAITALAALALFAMRSEWARRATQRWNGLPAVRAIRHNLALLATHPNEWVGVMLGSIAFQLLSILVIFILFSALATNATPAQCAVIAAMAGLSAALPISINGLGVMEGAFVATAVALNIDFETAVAVAFLRRAMAIVLAIPCAALWLTQGRELRPDAGPAELARYFAAWKRAGMRGLLDEIQPVATQIETVRPASETVPDVPLALPTGAADAGLSHVPLLEYTHDAIIIWEMQGRGILYWNQAAERLYGYPREEALGKVTHSLLHTEVTGGVVSLESALARYGVWLGELQHTTRSGQLVQVEGRLSLMAQQNGRWLVLEVNRDITDHKAAETARRRMEAQLAELREMIDRRNGA